MTGLLSAYDDTYRKGKSSVYTTQISTFSPTTWHNNSPSKHDPGTQTSNTLTERGKYMYQRTTWRSIHIFWGILVGGNRCLIGTFRSVTWTAVLGNFYKLRICPLDRDESVYWRSLSFTSFSYQLHMFKTLLSPIL